MINEGNLIVHRRDSHGSVQMAETSLEHLRDAHRTPNADFFVVHHYDPPPPRAVASGDVTIRTASGQERVVPLDELQQLPARALDALIECAGNGRRYLSMSTPGTQFGRGLCGLARWKGVSVRDLLAALGSDHDEYTTIVVRGHDRGWAFPEEAYSGFAKGLPRDKALHPDTLLAWSMNDEPLPHEHGGPVRLVVPGWVGVWWVKWVSHIELSTEEFSGFWQHERYRYIGGEFDRPEVVVEQLPRALITAPRDGSVVESGKLDIHGRAWSGRGPITRVEVSVDGGRTWTDAELGTPTSAWSWVEWRSELEVPAARVLVICARATDETGTTQAWDSRANSLGYGNNGIMHVTVRTR